MSSQKIAADEESDPERAAEENYDFDEQPPIDIVSYNELRSCADLNRLHVSGQLEIQPDFQREVVWTTPGQTRFIDSLIKLLPIPSMCFSFDQKARKFKVIDGLQRMSSITRFLGEAPWTLSRLKDIDRRISGKQNKEFDSDPVLSSLKERVENLTIPVNIIRCDYSQESHMNFLFAIFHRLNSGGAKLNNQEIRNCIYSGTFNDMLKQLDADDLAWQSIKERIAGSTARFKSTELILRFFAFEGNLDKYSGSFPKFLNNYMQARRTLGEEEETTMADKFVRTTAFIHQRILPVLQDRGGFAFWEALMVGVGRNIDSLVNRDDDVISTALHRFRGIPELAPEALRAALSGTEKVKARISGAVAAFS